jgi:hypothetical protein
MASIRVVTMTLAAFIVGGAGVGPVLAQTPPVHWHRFDLDDKAAPHELLPPAPRAVPPGNLLTEDLARVPEVHFQEPILKTPKSDKAALQIARQMAKINLLNKRRPDLFLETLLEHRPDLAGLPFVTGDACRLSKADRPVFRGEVTWVRSRFESTWPPENAGVKGFWRDHHAHVQTRLKDKGGEHTARFTIAAFMQILGPEGPYHRGLVDCLAAFGKLAEMETTEALARLAVFSTDKEVRQAALAALQKRPPGPATATLLKGLRYPWPAVARNAAEAVLQLRRTDMLGELVNLLEEPDPRAPVAREIKGQKVPVVRELVRINHHRNCLLCHLPGNTADVFKIPDGYKYKEVEKDVWAASGYPEFDAEILFGGVPTPGEQFPSKSYGRFLTDRVVRADVTYLRQDFSLLHKIADADPWPESQRFDYVVRSRVLSTSEAQGFHKAFAGAEAKSPYREAALSALRRLTGQDAGTTAGAWRKALGL